MFFWNNVECQCLNLLTTSLLYHAVELFLEILILAGYIASVDPKRRRQTPSSRLPERMLAIENAIEGSDRTDVLNGGQTVSIKVAEILHHRQSTISPKSRTDFRLMGDCTRAKCTQVIIEWGRK